MFIFFLTQRIKPRNEVPGQEWFCLAFVLSLFTEEIRQLYHTNASRKLDKIREWAINPWNILDAMAIAIFVIAFGIRMRIGWEVYGQCIYAVDITIWIIRLLQIFYVNKHMGPYVVMVGRMVS